MEVGFLLLADHSEAVNGKLYMVGGGWNVLRLPELPHEWGFHIALGLDVGWDETNTSHELLVSVHDPDGAELGEGLSAEFEAGRPPGMPAGQEQRLVMSIGDHRHLRAPPARTPRSSRPTARRSAARASTSPPARPPASRTPSEPAPS